MKKIYFVRHGESEANVDPLTTSKNSLTEKGMEQAKIVAERFKNISVDVLIATSKIRSQQTAHEISLVKNIPVTENDLFIEKSGEFEMMWEHRHLSVSELTELMREKTKKPHWSYEKQELFDALKERAKKALEFLEKSPEEKIAIVTHGAFLKILIAYMIFKDMLTEEMALLFMKSTATQNTGITLCKFDPEQKHWRVITWNDQSHLG